MNFISGGTYGGTCDLFCLFTPYKSLHYTLNSIETPGTIKFMTKGHQQ